MTYLAYSLRLTARFTCGFIVFLSVSCLPLAISCHADFIDIPEKHWASNAVYELVKLGVTQGYPDGTFRGTKKLTRYEIAGLINEMVSHTGSAFESKKIIAELKTEYNLEKFRIINPALPVLTADLSANYCLSQKPTEKNLIADYRAILNLKRKDNLTITLDTIDAGFNNSSQRDFALELIDFESKFKFSEMDFEISFGGGDIIHEDVLTPEKQGNVFRRKKPSLSACIEKKHVIINSAYTILNNSSSGTVNSQDLSFGLGYKQGQLTSSVSAHYTRKSAEHDFLGLAEFYFCPSNDFRFGLDAGAGSNGTSSLYFGGNLKLWDLEIFAHRPGSRFRRTGLNKFDFLPLNLFNKYILDGSCDIGIKYIFKLNQALSLDLKSDLVLSGDYKYGEKYPGTSLTSEINLALKLNRNSKASLFYRLFEVPSGQNYADAALASSVPTRSDMLGLCLGIEL